MGGEKREGAGQRDMGKHRIMLDSFTTRIFTGREQTLVLEGGQDDLMVVPYVLYETGDLGDCTTQVVGLWTCIYNIQWSIILQL